MNFIKYLNFGTESADISLYANKFGIDKNVMEIIMNRGYRTEKQISEFLNSQDTPLQSPFTLEHMSEAVNKIKKAIIENKKILIFGDYDVDGISATAIMVKTFKKLKVNANYFLPNRYKDGYGLSVETLKKVISLYNPELIITVDCGITAVEEVEFLKSQNIDIIVTDHHELGEVLPDCLIINTKKENQEYLFRGLCGTGVAYKLSEALIGQEAEEFLPIVAIATIADIVPLVSENRTLVTRGLQNLNNLPVGLKEMFKANKVSITKPSSTDIAFKIAPKLNASGRMGDANDSLKLYFETNNKKINELLDKIVEHNTKRQELCNVVFDDATKMLQDENLSNVPAIILYSKTWDSGILGIVCSKLLEKYHRPVFLFSEENGVLKGSARSIQDINIHNILLNVKDILDVFGGHTMAAGLTLQIKKFEEFKKRVFSYIVENIDNKVFVPVEYYDLELNLGDINPKLLKDLQYLEPCGCENAIPKFMIKTDKIKVAPLKKFPNHANITIGKNLTLIYFNFVEESAKLNFGKDFYFIFDLQEFSYGSYKGMVKNFDCSFDLKNTAKQYLECFIVNQLCANKNVNKANFEFYESGNLLNFVLDLQTSAFGTLFVASSINTYNEFIRKYDTSKIYDFSLITGLKKGFNGIILAPQDMSAFKNYNKIVFIDPVLSLDFIKSINQISTAKIFLPKDTKNAKTLLDNLDLTREHFGVIYNILKKIQKMKFNSFLSMYSHICKTENLKFSFNNLLVPLLVFKELGLVEIVQGEGTIFVNVNKIKNDITNSSIYNNLNLLNKIK